MGTLIVTVSHSSTNVSQGSTNLTMTEQQATHYSIQFNKQFRSRDETNKARYNPKVTLRSHPDFQFRSLDLLHQVMHHRPHQQEF